MKDLCECGHLKECHQAHTLDPKGGNCQHCKCEIFTWVSFLWTDKEMKDAKQGERK